MPGNLFTPVSVRRRCAAHRCANAHTDARRAQRAGDGREDQVDVDFGQDSERFRGDYGADNRANNILFHTFSAPGSSPVRWVKVQHQGSQARASTVHVRGQSAMIRDLTSRSTAPSLKTQEKRPFGPKFLGLRRA